MGKVQKVESLNAQNDCETMSKKKADSSCGFTQRGTKKYKKRWRVLIQRIIMKQRIKIEQIKGKTCHVCFVKVIKFQENRFKIIQNNF